MEGNEIHASTVYSSQFKLLHHFADTTKKYLTDDRKLGEGEDFKISLLKNVQGQFSPIHSNMVFSDRITENLNVKKTVVNKCGRAFHEQAYYVAT